MKKVYSIIALTLLLLVGYNLYLFFFPLRKQVFYTNEERIQEFIYNRNDYQTVLIGSSLSGIFEKNDVFSEGNSFMMYLPFTGSLSGLEVLNRTGKLPKQLFMEINHVDRGTDSALMHSLFDEPVYSMRYYLPFLQTKNKMLPNLIDRVKSPANNKINESKPEASLFNTMLQKEIKEWEEIKDEQDLNRKLNAAADLINSFASKGVQIYFYEMPVDSSLTELPLIRRQREFFMKLAGEKKYTFIPVDTGRAYQTGDGVHLLRKDADIYLEYFRNAIKKTAN